MMREAGAGSEPSQSHFHAESKLSWTIAGKWRDELTETELSKLREVEGPLKCKSWESPFSTGKSDKITNTIFQGPLCL